MKNQKESNGKEGNKKEVQASMKLFWNEEAQSYELSIENMSILLMIEVTEHLLSRTKQEMLKQLEELENMTDTNTTQSQGDN